MDREPQEFLVPIPDNECQPWWGQVQYLEALSPLFSTISIMEMLFHNSRSFLLNLSWKRSFICPLIALSLPYLYFFLSLAHTLFSGSQCQQITLISMATCCTHVYGENNPQVGGNWVGKWPPNSQLRHLCWPLWNLGCEASQPLSFPAPESGLGVQLLYQRKSHKFGEIKLLVGTTGAEYLKDIISQ